MTVAGEALAQQVREYLSLRHSSPGPIRLLVTKYPRPVLEMACRALVASGRFEQGSGFALDLAGSEFPVEIGLIQPAGELSADGILVGNSKNGPYTFGTGPDHPVALRNRQGSSIIVVPPELLDQCHESLKQNSFQAFDDDRRYGAENRLFERIATLIGANSAEAPAVGRVFREIRKNALETRGEPGDLQSFSRLDAFAEKLAVRQSAASDPIEFAKVDWRALGLLPQRALVSALQATVERVSAVAKAVDRNLTFQERLLDDLSREQYRAIQRRFQGTAGFGQLEAFLAEHQFRLDPNDPTWRAGWPSSLFIEELERSDTRSTSQRIIRRFRIENASESLGIPTISSGKPLTLSWRIAPDESTPGEVFVDRLPVAEADLRTGRFQLTAPAASGFHEVSLDSTDSKPLDGTTALRFLVPGSTGTLLASVDSLPAGSAEYRVRAGATFRVRWLVVPDPGGRSRLTLEDGDEIEALYDEDGASGSFDLIGGIEDDAELSIQVETPVGALTRRLRLDTERKAVSDTAATTSLALLALADSLGPEAQRPPGEVEASFDGASFQVQFIGDPPVNRTFAIEDQPALEALERAFIDTPGAPWPRILAEVASGNQRSWVAASAESVNDESFARALPAAELRAYLHARRVALEALGKAGGVARCSLSQHAVLIAEYASAYRSLLVAATRGETSALAHHVALNLTDCILVRGNIEIAVPEASVPFDTEDDRTTAILISPTHPLRLAWLCAFERRVRELFSSEDQWTTSSLRSLSSQDLPACVIDWSFAHFHSLATAGSGLWTIGLREGIAEFDLALPAAFARSVRFDTGQQVATATAEQLAAAIAEYQGLHPFRDTIRISYFKPGTAETLLGAVERLTAGKAAPRGEVAKSVAQRVRYDLDLIDLYTAAPDREAGLAFEQLGAEEAADPEFLQRVGVRVQRVREEPFVEGSARIDPTHIAFGSEVLSVGGRSELITDRAMPLSFDGLLVPSQRTFDVDPAPRITTHSFVARPEKWATKLSANDSFAEIIHDVLFGIQCIASATADRRTVSETQGRALIAEVGLRTARVIDRMHDQADWVYIVDSHVDVEYFDRPTNPQHYIIDYVPRHIASANGNRAHNYVVTTRRKETVLAAINRYLQSAYTQPSAPHGAADRLMDALNRISGRLLLLLVGDPSLAKGAVGLGLTQLLYAKAGLLGAPQIAGDGAAGPGVMRVLIPVDDYIRDWLFEYRLLHGSDAAGQHADLLDVELRFDEDDVLRVTIQIVEVKNRRESYSAQQLRTGPVAQISQMAEVLGSLLSIGETERRADVPVKDWQFSQLLDFHLRRTSMQVHGLESRALDWTRRFRRRVVQAVAGGRYSAPWRTNAGRQLLGVVMHFNAASDVDGIRAGEVISGTSSDAIYVSVGKPDIMRLLSGEDPNGFDRFASAILPGPPSGPKSNVGEGTNPATTGDVGISADQSMEETPSSTVVTQADLASLTADMRATETANQSSVTGPDESGSAQSSSSKEEDAVRNAFLGFVGNEAAVRRMTPYLLIAARRSPPRLPVNLAFTGPASTGKTEISRRIARFLGLPFVSTTGSALRALDDLLTRMERALGDTGAALRELGREGGLPIRRFPPMVVFIDEAHEMRPAVQESLLTLLEPDTRRAIGSRFIGDASEVTFLLATTDWGDLINTVQTRLQRVPLEPYTQEEVAEMVRRRYPELSDSVSQRLAIAGRIVPRVALQKAQEFANAREAFPERPVEQLLEEYFALWQIDDLGIDDADREYLRALDRSAGSVGLQRLQNVLSRGEKELTRNVEPYLQHIGFIEISGQGRRLTDEGKEYLRRLGAS